MGISITHLLIVAVIVVLVFGTKKLRSLGSDLGESVKGFKKAISDDDKSAASEVDAEFHHQSIHDNSSSSNVKETRNKQDQV